jgi:hypothetical protein
VPSTVRIDDAPVLDALADVAAEFACVVRTGKRPRGETAACCAVVSLREEAATREAETFCPHGLLREAALLLPGREPSPSGLPPSLTRFSLPLRLSVLSDWLRRAVETHAAVKETGNGGRAVLSLKTRVLAFPDGEAAHLTEQECAVLRILAQSGESVVPTERLVSLLWGGEGEHVQRRLHSAVYRLRAKDVGGGLLSALKYDQEKGGYPRPEGLEIDA